MFYIVNENLRVLFTYENRKDAVAAFDRLWKAGNDVSIEDENDRLSSLAFLNRHKKRQLQRAIDNPIQLTQFSYINKYILKGYDMKVLMYMMWIVILIHLVFIAFLADGFTLFLVTMPVVMLAMVQYYEDKE